MIKERLGSDLDAVVYRLFPFVRSLPFHPDTLTLTGAAVSLFAACAFAERPPVHRRAPAHGRGLLRSGRRRRRATAGRVVERGRVLRLVDRPPLRPDDLRRHRGRPASAGDATGTALVMWALTASVMTSYTRASAEKRLHTLKVGFVERGERFGVLILGALTGFVMTAVVLIAIGATITSVQRVLAGRRLLARARRDGRGSDARGGGQWRVSRADRAASRWSTDDGERSARRDELRDARALADQLRAGSPRRGARARLERARARRTCRSRATRSTSSRS